MAKTARIDEEAIAAKNHRTYFEEYFSEFCKDGPLTIVVEWSYTDHDYLEDYAAYYVRCFEGKYESTCARLHFFRGRFTRDQFIERAINSKNRDESGHSVLQKDYLGFIVAKPLPNAVIGRTCLLTYGEDNGRRNYPVTRPYKVHLLGHDLEVRSIAFQEQDQVAAACASSAIWSAFQGTSSLFHHQVPSPVEVTRLAFDRYPGLRRALPNKGLNPLQLSAVIKGIGLEPETLGIKTRASLQAASYAYLRAHIPIILVARLYEGLVPEACWYYDDDPHGMHAVAIMGYSIGESECTSFSPKRPTLLRSSRIDKLYVHDDQVGPFARLTFSEPLTLVRGNDVLGNTSFSMRSSWKSLLGSDAIVYFEPESIVVPLYHKVRIGIDAVLGKVFADDEDFRRKIVSGMEDQSHLEWDVFLQTSSEFKKEIRNHGIARGLSEQRLCGLLEKSMPRFIWRATLLYYGVYVLDRIFDATDIETGNFEIDVIDYL